MSLDSLFDKFEDKQADFSYPGDDAPELEGTVNSTWIPPMCDVYTSKAIYVWHKLVGRVCLDTEECGHYSVGRLPAWRYWDESYSVHDMLTADTSSYEEVYIHWALEHGVAPGQPFLLRINEPEYTRCGGYDGYDEFDVDWSYEFIRAVPWSRDKALRSWAAFTSNLEKYYEVQEAKSRRVNAFQIQNVKGLRLHYPNSGWGNEVLRADLRAEHPWRYMRTIARGKGASIEAAKLDLVRAINTEVEGLTASFGPNDGTRLGPLLVNGHPVPRSRYF